MNCVCKWFLAQTWYWGQKCFLHRHTEGFCHKKKHVNCFPIYTEGFHLHLWFLLPICIQCVSLYAMWNHSDITAKTYHIVCHKPYRKVLPKSLLWEQWFLRVILMILVGKFTHLVYGLHMWNSTSKVDYFAKRSPMETCSALEDKSTRRNYHNHDMLQICLLTCI